MSMATLIGLVMRLESPISAEHVLFFFTDGSDCVGFVLDVVVASTVVVSVVAVVFVLVVDSTVVAVVEDGLNFDLDFDLNFLDLSACAALFVRFKEVGINSSNIDNPVKAMRPL